MGLCLVSIVFILLIPWTGCSSGIGLATVEVLLQQGAIVTAGDIKDSTVTHPNFSSIKTDVTDWASLTALFKHALKHHSTIDHVHANAGIAPMTRYIEENLDSNGDLLEPPFGCLDVTLRGVLNTCALAIHYMRKDANAADHSIVITASELSFSFHSGVDYTTAKHGVLGFMRGLGAALAHAKIPVRINAVAPGWVATSMVRESLLKATNSVYQQPIDVARPIALLMADVGRDKQMIYASGGKYREIEEAVLLKCLPQIIDTPPIDEALHKLYEAFEEETKGKETADHEAKI